MIAKNKAKESDFFIEIDGVGRFRFSRKTYGAQIKIDAEISRILGPNMDLSDSTMGLHAMLMGHYKALMVECPPGWENLEELNLDEDPTLDQKILEVYFELRRKLDSFRKSTGNNPAGQGAGAGDAQHDRVLGASQVQPAANGSPVA